jgi:hypothetical protein
MVFEIARPVAVQPTGTGFSIALQYTARKKSVRITITEAAQLEHFKTSLADKKLDVMIGRDADRGRIKLVLAEEGLFEAKKSARGSVFITVQRWNLLPEDKRPAQPMQVAFIDATGVTLMVPDYSKVRPSDTKDVPRVATRATPMA